VQVSGITCSIPADVADELLLVVNGSIQTVPAVGCIPALLLLLMGAALAAGTPEDAAAAATAHIAAAAAGCIKLADDIPAAPAATCCEDNCLVDDNVCCIDLED
jgi:hypothetical protein